MFAEYTCYANFVYGNHSSQFLNALFFYDNNKMMGQLCLLQSRLPNRPNNAYFVGLKEFMLLKNMSKMDRYTASMKLYIWHSMRSVKKD